MYFVIVMTDEYTCIITYLCGSQAKSQSSWNKLSLLGKETNRDICQDKKGDLMFALHNLF
jgi:hypothetical protein